MEGTIEHSAHMQGYGKGDSIGQPWMTTPMSSLEDIDNAKKHGNINVSDAMSLNNNFQLDVWGITIWDLSQGPMIVNISLWPWIEALPC